MVWLSLKLSLKLQDGSTPRAYNLLMPRAVALTLLVLFLLPVSLQAQRTGISAGSSARSTFSVPSHFANGFPRRGAFAHERHRHGYGPIVYPYYFPYEDYDEGTDYERPYTVVKVQRESAPAVISPPASEPVVPKAQIIELPVAASSGADKPLPLTIFILANGERLETRRFLLTAATLSVNGERRQRTIPVDQLNLDATIAANHSRGIELQVPADRNEILIRF
jgi:hypothetical protein